MDMTKTWESAFFEKILAGTDKAAFDPKDTEKYYLREMKELRNRAEAVINTHYEGQGYMPVDLIVELINQIKPTSGQHVAVFDRISALMMKMVGCDVTLFDKGAGFVNSGMKFDIVVGNPPFSKQNEGKTAGKKGVNLYPAFYKKAVEVANVVAMIMPKTLTQQGKHNDLLNKTAYKFIDVPMDSMKVGIIMWTVFYDKKKAPINYIRKNSVNNDIQFTKGKFNLSGIEFKTQADAEFSQRVIKGVYVDGTNYVFIRPEDSKRNTIRKRNTMGIRKAKFYVLLPLTIHAKGWSSTDIVAYSNDIINVNVTCIPCDSLEEAKIIQQLITSEDFITKANKVKGNQGVMTISNLKAITI